MNVKRLMTLLALCGTLWMPVHAQTPTELSASDMALGFYQPLAEEGSPYAQLVLGEMYLDGNGVDQDLVQAYAWFHVSADQGVEEAEPLREDAWDKMSSEQREEARRLAEDYARVFRE